MMTIGQKPSTYFNKAEIATVQAYVDSLGEDGPANMAKLVIHLIERAQTEGSDGTPVTETPEYRKLYADWEKVIEANKNIAVGYTELGKPAPPQKKAETKTDKPADKSDKKTEDKKGEDTNLSFIW
jgi:hypothetical protein